MNKVKVVLLAPGKSTHTHKWAAYFKKRNIDVTVITFKDHYSAENAKEVHTVCLPKLLPGKLSYLTAVYALKGILKKLKPDIVHAHFVSSYGFVGALTGFYPFYVSVWGTDIYQFPTKNAINRKIVEFTLSKADVICSTSYAMAEETSKYTAKPIDVTPFGVDLALFNPHNTHRSQPGYRLGIIKGLEDIYGFRDLFKAVSILQNRFNGLSLTVIGDGPMKEEYMELCRSLGIDGKTIFTGRIPNSSVPDYLNGMDLIVLPSYEDSFGVTAVEAMACGVPVVVSDAPGLLEVVKDGVTGIVVPSGNPEKLAKAIEGLLNDVERRQAMGLAGAEHVRRQYDWDENASRMIKLYNKKIQS